jgi:hypothetical protein
VGRSPGAALITDILPQQKRLQAVLGGLEITDGVLPSADQIPDGLVLHFGDIDRREILRAHESCELRGIAPVGLDPISGLLGDERRGDHPAGEPFLGEVAIEPVATRAGLVDEDQGVALGLELADELVDVALTSPDATQRDHFCIPLLGGIRHRDRLLMGIQTDVQCARLVFYSWG